MNEIFQRTLKEKIEGDFSWEKIDMVTPDGAYDAVGNLVKVGDTVKLCIDGEAKITRVRQLEPINYQGKFGIDTELYGWCAFWRVLKI